MKKYIFILLLLIIVCVPFKIKAECSYENKTELNELASHIDYSYDYVDLTKTYNVTFNNVVSQLTLNYNGLSYNSNGNKVIINEIVNTGENKVSVIGSNSSKCPNEPILELYLKLPIYNEFSQRSECKEYPEFKYCDKFLDTEIDENDFISSLEDYIFKVEKDKFLSNYKVKDKEEGSLLSSLTTKDKIFIIIDILLLIVLIINLVLFRRKK